MNKECIIEIKDEVNCRFTGLDIVTRRKLQNELKFYLPYARHLPSVKLGKWDGSVSYCDIGGRTYINLLDKVLPIIIADGYSIKVDDNRDKHDFQFEKINKDSYSHVMWPEGHRFANTPIQLRDHQVDIVNSFMDSPTGISVAATGAGKSISTAILSHKIEKYGRSILIVPSKDLVTQTEVDYVNLGLDTGVYYGDRKEFDKMHTICTWQSLEFMHKAKDGSIDRFLEGVAGVIVDECHRSKADVLKKLLSGPFANVPIRWGLTGTLPEEDFERMSLEACIGGVLGGVSAKELQDKGILASININVLQLKDPEGMHGNYQSELSWITTNKNRIEHIANMITDISKSGNTLVLVDRIKTGEMLEEFIDGCKFVSGQMKSKDRKVEYDSIDLGDGKVVVASYGVASTGISINRIHNLVLLEPGKSFVRVIQSIGRGLRVADDKKHVEVYDITSSCKFAKRHLTQRKKHYKSAEYPFKIKKIDYL
jgi:superfamily II DNA or RNA helicase